MCVLRSLDIQHLDIFPSFLWPLEDLEFFFFFFLIFLYQFLRNICLKNCIRDRTTVLQNPPPPAPLEVEKSPHPLIWGLFAWFVWALGRSGDVSWTEVPIVLVCVGIWAHAICQNMSWATTGPRRTPDLWNSPEHTCSPLAWWRGPPSPRLSSAEQGASLRSAELWGGLLQSVTGPMANTEVITPACMVALPSIIRAFRRFFFLLHSFVQQFKNTSWVSTPLGTGLGAEGTACRRQASPPPHPARTFSESACDIHLNCKCSHTFWMPQLSHLKWLNGKKQAHLLLGRGERVGVEETPQLTVQKHWHHPCFTKWKITTELWSTSANLREQIMAMF